MGHTIERWLERFATCRLFLGQTSRTFFSNNSLEERQTCLRLKNNNLRSDTTCAAAINYAEQAGRTEKNRGI